MTKLPGVFPANSTAYATALLPHRLQVRLRYFLQSHQCADCPKIRQALRAIILMAASRFWGSFLGRDISPAHVAP
ncbi:MAG: hypothetical protein NZ899_13765 [Thermoguttaceae bacterium]|nr:hypothetical protein [Thermoguttaceae bacterium]